MWPTVYRRQCFWLRKRVCICTATESPPAGPRDMLLAQFILQKWRDSDGGCGDRSMISYVRFFLSCWILQRQKCDPTSLFHAVKPGWQLPEYQRMGKWNAVPARTLVIMPIIHVSINRTSYALRNLQFVIQTLYVLPLICFCTNLVLTNVKNATWGVNNNTGSCVRKPI